MLKLLRKFNFIFLLTTSWACTEMLEPSDRLGYSFFPLQKGQYWIYDVTQIDYLNTGDVENSTYQVQLVITDSLVDEAGQLAFLAYKYIRNNATEQWRSESSILLERNSINAVWTENNKALIVLTFPIEEGKSWNGNARNALERDDFSYSNVYQEFVISSDTLSNTLQVIQEDNNDSLIFHDKRIQVFQENTGLVYQVFSQLNFCRETDCIGLQQIDFGLSYEWKLLEYGKDD